MAYPTLRPLCLILSVCFACVADDSNAQGGSETAGGEAAEYAACGLPSPCSPLTVNHLFPGEAPDDIDVDTAQCILTALAAGEPARLQFTKTSGAWEEWASTVWILEPGVAFHRYVVAGDESPGTTTEQGQAIDVAAVMTCAESQDPGTLSNCLFDGWIAGPAEVDGCPE